MKVKLLVRIAGHKHGSTVDLEDLKKADLSQEQIDALFRRRLIFKVGESDLKSESAPKKKAAPKVDHKPSLSDGDL